MKKILLGLALLAGTAGAFAASVTEPAAGVAYTITNNANGNAMTADGVTLSTAPFDAAIDNFRFEFVPVSGQSGVYNIKCSDGKLVGTDGKWTATFYTDAANAKAQYKIVVSAGDAECVNLVNVDTNKNLGCDAGDAKVYTDKADGETHRWVIAAAPKATSITAPAADKYYRVRHASGLYLTENNFGAKLTAKADNNNQIVRFIAVDPENGVYNIQRMASGMFYGTDNKWTSAPLSRNVPASQYKIALSEANEGYITLQNLGMNAAKSFLGADETAAESGVYTDKDGKAANLHTWWIEEAQFVHAPIPTDLDNLLVNGDFEDTAFVQDAEKSEDDFFRLTDLPGWTLEDGTTWGGAHSMEEADGVHFLTLQGYGDANWECTPTAKQTLAVKANRNHALVFDVKHLDDACVWVARVWEMRDVQKDVQGTIVTAKEKTTLAEIRSTDPFDEWTRHELRFKPTSTEVTVELALINKKTTWRDKKVCFNNVAIHDLDPKDFYEEFELPANDPRANAYDGYRLVFAEEFTGDHELDHDVWNFETGFKRNNEDQYYNGDKNCYLEDGSLIIEGKYVLPEKIRNPKYDKYNKNWPSKIGEYLTWTSGSMQTKGQWNGGYTWNFGIYEVRARVPQHVGSWPAIWSTGMQYEWPYGGEIDLMEYYGHCIHGNVCWGNGNRWSGAWNSATVHDNVLGAGWGEEFHIWRMVWDYDHMEMWCDDILVNNINLDTTNNKVPSDNFDHGAEGTNPFRDVRHMLWLNLALGGNNGGSLANTPRHLYYQIDYARVYQKIGTDGKAKYHVEEEISEPKYKKDSNTGVNNITVADENAPVEYFNLQGIRVENPANGIFIRRQGNTTTKVIL